MSNHGLFGPGNPYLMIILHHVHLWLPCGHPLGGHDRLNGKFHNILRIWLPLSLNIDYLGPGGQETTKLFSGNFVKFSIREVMTTCRMTTGWP